MKDEMKAKRVDSRCPMLTLRARVHVAPLDSPSPQKAHPLGSAHPCRAIPIGSIPAGSILVRRRSSC